MKWLAIAALIVLTGCETTRSNNGKLRARPIYCEPLMPCDK